MLQDVIHSDFYSFFREQLELWRQQKRQKMLSEQNKNSLPNDRYPDSCAELYAASFLPH
jgi:hypothetical protein